MRPLQHKHHTSKGLERHLKKNSLFLSNEVFYLWRWYVQRHHYHKIHNTSFAELCSRDLSNTGLEVTQVIIGLWMWRKSYVWFCVPGSSTRLVWARTLPGLSLRNSTSPGSLMIYGTGISGTVYTYITVDPAMAAPQNSPCILYKAVH